MKITSPKTVNQVSPNPAKLGAPVAPAVRNNEQEDKRIRQRFIEHTELVLAFRAAGLDCDTASKLAFKQITQRKA
jgi:hypothetical protein